MFLKIGLSCFNVGFTLSTYILQSLCVLNTIKLFFLKFFMKINYYLVYVEDKQYSQIKRETKLFSIAIISK
jgi:hypothetical protein